MVNTCESAIGASRASRPARPGQKELTGLHRPGRVGPAMNQKVPVAGRSHERQLLAIVELPGLGGPGIWQAPNPV